jgi:hypothetical protein
VNGRATPVVRGTLNTSADTGQCRSWNAFRPAKLKPLSVTGNCLQQLHGAQFGLEQNTLSMVLLTKIS